MTTQIWPNRHAAGSYWPREQFPVRSGYKVKSNAVKYNRFR